MFGSSTFLVWIATFTIGLLLGIPYVETQSQPGTNPKRFQTPQPTAQPGPRANPAPKNVLDGLAMEVLGEVTVDGTEPLLGRADAPYLIVEWADYGCPHCALAATGLKGLVESTPDVQVRFKNFPLSGLCNPNIPTQEQVERCLSAIAAKCTQDQGKFWEYQSAIFANQTYLFLQSPSFEQDLANIADRVGVNRERWEACITDEGVADVIREEARQGGQAGVLGTPFITLQGVYDRPVQVPDVRAATMLIEAHKLGRSLPAPAPHASL
jgi:protein-disulfide isomerase